jgi:hypothetical protein
MALKRPCLGCGRLVRGRSRCPRCQLGRDRAKTARRPEFKTATETKRRREVVATHRAQVGDWCPGVPELHRPAHPAARLQADHVVEVAAGGAEDGPLIVRCGPCNAARSANVRRAFPQAVAATPRQPESRLHTAPDSPPPVVA